VFKLTITPRDPESTIREGRQDSNFYPQTRLIGVQVFRISFPPNDTDES
jgi:hypothetical protein